PQREATAGGFWAGRDQELVVTKNSNSGLDPAAFDRAAILSRHPLFRELGREVQNRIAAYATTKAIKRGTALFSRGDAGTCLFAVCSGTVEVAILSVEGKNAIVNLINAGEVL